MNGKTYDFHERLLFSECVELNDSVLSHIRDTIPGATAVCRADVGDDRNGTDYWIHRDPLPPVSVDLKHRSFCPVERWGKGSDDACIEVASVYHGDPAAPFDATQVEQLGWTVDATKRTDLVVYTWPVRGQSARRFWILYFPHLCRAAGTHWPAWAAEYTLRYVFTQDRYGGRRGWQTVCVYPPRAVIAAAMRELTVGRVA